MAAVMAHTTKRKRETADLPSVRSAPGHEPDFAQQYIDENATENADANADFAAVLRADGPAGRGDQSASDTATAALAQFHTMTVPTSTEQIFAAQAENGGKPEPADEQGAAFADESFVGVAGPNGDGTPADLADGHKPSVGTDAWHKIRRDNHKEVERRRRETINEGINELAKIVPGCEKNKGSILARSVQFITELKNNENENIQKWGLEKMLTEQAITELSTSLDTLKAECSRAWAECEAWKAAAQKAGIEVEVDKETGHAISK